MFTHIQFQVVMYFLRCDRGKMTPQVSALLLSRPPEQLLLAPKVALAIHLLPASGALWCAFVCLACILMDLKV